MRERDRIQDANARVFRYLYRLAASHSSEGAAGKADAEFWPRVIRLASEQLVLNAIADVAAGQGDPLTPPGDVSDFLRQMENSNRQRNEWLLDALIEANAALQKKGIRAVALKGAAFLAENVEDSAAWRFFGDLDFLVREDDLLAAVSVLKGLGYIESPTVYHPNFHRHYPFLKHPDGYGGIDVHTRLAASAQSILLDPVAFLEGAVPLKVGGSDVLVPSITDRLAHLIVNAQVLDYRFERRLFRLRDVLDFADLSGRGADLSDIRQRFSRYGSVRPFDAYLAMMERVLDTDADQAAVDEKTKQWVLQVERVIRDPRRARSHVLKHWLRMVIAKLVDPQERRFLLESIKDPRQRDEFISRRASYWKIFHR